MPRSSPEVQARVVRRRVIETHGARLRRSKQQRRNCAHYLQVTNFPFHEMKTPLARGVFLSGICVN